MEQELFNGVLSGEQLDGTRYFYVNPLEAESGFEGQPDQASHSHPPCRMV